MSVTNQRGNDVRVNPTICRDGEKKYRVSVCCKIYVRYKRDRVWIRWDINILCDINNNINPNMYISKLRFSENINTTIFNINNRDRVFINRSIYSNGCVRILCII